MRLRTNRSPQSARVRLAAAVAALTLVGASCGGGGDSGDAATEADAAPSGGANPGGAGANGGSPAGLSGAVDLGGPEVDPASDIETNPFSDLVVDDVSRGKKVNLRNLIPSEKPVLVWMWAPH